MNVGSVKAIFIALIVIKNVSREWLSNIGKNDAPASYT